MAGMLSIAFGDGLACALRHPTASEQHTGCQPAFTFVMQYEVGRDAPCRMQWLQVQPLLCSLAPATERLASGAQPGAWQTGLQATLTPELKMMLSDVQVLEASSNSVHLGYGFAPEAAAISNVTSAGRKLQEDEASSVRV